MKKLNCKTAVAIMLSILTIVQIVFMAPKNPAKDAVSDNLVMDTDGKETGDGADNDEVSKVQLNVVYRSNVKANATVDKFENSIENNDYSDKIVSYTCEELPIYSLPDVKSDKTGIMYSGSEAKLLEKGAEWSKISSGKVTGYVRNVEVLFGAEAEIIASSIGNKVAEVTAESLSVYTDADDKSAVISTLHKGAKIEAYEECEGYVFIICDNGYGYIKVDGVDISYGLKEAMTIAEIEAIEAKKREEAAKLAAQQAAAQAEANKQQALQNQVTQGTVTRAPYTASAEDIHLLAAIIYWESGWEPAHGQLAVANVVLNRVYSPRFKQNNIPDVIYAPGQFTGVLENGKISARFQEVLNKSNEELNVRGCYDAALRALAGENNIGDMLFFISVRKANYSRYTGYTIINNHCFYVY